MNRRTRIYVMAVNLEPELIEERMVWMIETVGQDTAGALPSTDGIVFAFRATDDEEADRVATYLAVDALDFQLWTGLGVHRRDVVVA